MKMRQRKRARHAAMRRAWTNEWFVRRVAKAYGGGSNTVTATIDAMRKLGHAVSITSIAVTHSKD